MNRNSYHGRRPTCKRDAAAPGRGQGEIKDLATPAACQERRKKINNKITPAEIGRLPAHSDPALKRDVAALDSSGWFSRYQGCSRQKASLSLSFSLYFFLFPSIFCSTLDPVAVLSSHLFVSLHFGLLSGGVKAPSGLWQRGLGGLGRPAPWSRCRWRCMEKRRVFWGGGRQRFTPQRPPHFTPTLWYLEALWP